MFILIQLIFISNGFSEINLSYEYDASGNLIEGDGKYYEYNDANQLVRVKHGDENGGVISEYFYDSNGQRIKKIEDGVTTYYIGKHFETEVNGANPGNASYYFANGERVAKKDTADNLSYFHSDHLGGTNAVTDSSGNLTERTIYYPFGEIREGGKERYTYTGKEKDKGTGFYYLEARFYNPEFKHFTQADTVAPKFYDPQDLNRYAYVRNNPLKYTDPDGHSWWNPFSWSWLKSLLPYIIQTKIAVDNIETPPKPIQVETDNLTSEINNKRYVHQDYKDQQAYNGGQCVQFAIETTNYTDNLGWADDLEGHPGLTMDDYLERAVNKNQNIAFMGSEGIGIGNIVVLDEKKNRDKKKYGTADHVAVVVDIKGDTLAIKEANYGTVKQGKEEIPKITERSISKKEVIGYYNSKLKEKK